MPIELVGCDYALPKSDLFTNMSLCQNNDNNRETLITG